MTGRPRTAMGNCGTWSSSASGAVTGPVTGSGRVAFNPSSYATSVGGFNLSSVSGDTTFQATVGVAAVPEPATFATAGLAGVVGLGYGWRRRKAKASA